MAQQRSAGGLITETISSLIGGVSQQADAVRQPHEAKEILNCLLSPVEGLKRRPPTQIVQNLWPVFSSNITLAPYSRTIQEAGSSQPQITALTFGVENAGTKFSVIITLYVTTPFGQVTRVDSAYYTVQEGDTLSVIANNLATAINASASGDVNAGVQMDNTINLTGAVNNSVFSVSITRDVTTTPGAIAPASLFTHVINRDLEEKYAVFVANGKLTVVDLLARNFPTVTVVGDANDYLDTDTPGVSLRALTIGDYTFIINREIDVEKDSSVMSDTRDPEALLWVRMGNYGTKYSVTLDGNLYTWYADKEQSRWIDTTKLAQAIANKIPGGRDSAKLVITGTWAIGDTITIKNTAPFGGAFSDATTTYTVKADANDPTIVESNHSIAVGVAEAWNFLDLDPSAGAINAVPVAYDDQLDLQDNAVLFYGPTPLQGASYGYYGTDININMSATKVSTSGVVTVTNNSTQAATYEVTVNGSSIRVRKYNSFNSGSPSSSTFQDFTISSADGLGDQSLRAIKGEVQTIQDLPSRAIDGFMIKVIGDVSTDKDDFYVQYHDSVSVTNDGTWKETLKGGEYTSLDPATMPHILVRNGNGTFTYKRADWDPRLVGDLVTAPMPSFVDSPIDDLMFHKNRLGFASGQNTVYSQVGVYFNFFRVSIQQLLDEDIIDYGVAATEVAPIRHVVPMQNKVILWSDKQQFAQTGDPVFVAKTIAVERVTGFEVSERVKPRLIGKDIFFCMDRNNSTRLMEFYSTDNGTVNDADNNTVKVPSYLKGKPMAICGGINSNMVFVATLQNMNDLYVYNFLWKGTTLVQSAWSTWRFQDGNILAIDYYDNSLLLVIQRGSIVMLERIDILPADVDNQPQDTPSDHLVHLDLRFGTEDFADFGVPAPTYASGRTTWTFASDANSAVPHNPLYPMRVVKKATPSDPTTPELPDIQRPAANQISASGDWRTTDVWIGLHYDTEFDFSRFYKKEQSEDGASNSLLEGVTVKSITDGTTIVHNLYLDYIAGYFTVEVQPTGRSTPYVYEFDGDDETSQGTFPVPIQAENDQVTIKIKNSTHRPCTFTGFAWDGLYQRRTVGK